MDMIREGNIIALRLSAAGTFVDLPVYLTFSAAEGLIPIAVEFYIQPYRLEAKISLDGYFQNKVGEIKLPGALSGEGRIRLGGGVDKSTLDKSILDKPTLDKSMLDKSTLKNETVLAALTLSSEEYKDYQTMLDSAEEISASIPAAVETFPDTVWDELAILFSAVPLLPEELPETVAEEEDAADVQHEATVDTRPVEIKPVVVDVPLSNAAETDDADTRSAEAGSPDTDADNSVQEHETQERNALIVLSENF